MKAHLKAAGRAFLAAVTSRSVVPIEKKLAVFILVRVLVALGASAGLVELVSKYH
jgi:hypothetical protein